MNLSFPHPSPWVSAIFLSTIDKYLKFQVTLSCSEIKYDYFLVLKQSLYRVGTNHKIEFVSCSQKNTKQSLYGIVAKYKIELVWCRSKVQNRACMVSQQSTKQSFYGVVAKYKIEFVSCSKTKQNRACMVSQQSTKQSLYRVATNYTIDTDLMLM